MEIGDIYIFIAHYVTFKWRASEASDILIGLNNGNLRYMYKIDYS